ncbi:MAG: hypothetical protein JWL86_3201 [Rhizobium sp.]|nr:hypothetical protein [Rhizobium sp.]
MRRFLVTLFALVAFIVSSLVPAQAATVVPPGNRNVEQPAVPGASKRRTKAGKTTFDRKYAKVVRLLARDKKLISKIKSIAGQYGIAPIHMVGALVGEHTYNVDAYDRLQAYYVKAAAYSGDKFRFAYEGQSIQDLIALPQFADCASKSGSYELWTCRERVWNKSFSGRQVGGMSYPNNRFSAVFFQPFYAGQTFGLGQINPLTALELSDLVAQVSGYPKLDENDAGEVYASIMDPDKSLAYMAASIKMSIDEYRKIAGVDISKNPGITATLYNTGNPRERAYELKAKGAGTLPEENYYGWLINDKLAELEALL